MGSAKCRRQKRVALDQLGRALARTPDGLKGRELEFVRAMLLRFRLAAQL
jgi:hypothetical protein